MPRLLPFPRRSSIGSIQSVVMDSSSRDNLSVQGRQPIKKRAPLSITKEEDSNEDENQNAMTQRHQRSSTEEHSDADPNPHFVITPATMPLPDPEAHTPDQIALLNNPLYRHIRESTINDVIAFLRDSQHHSLPPALSNVAYRPVPSLQSDIGSPVLGAYSEAYLNDPHFYNPGRGRRSRHSSQLPFSHISPTSSHLRFSHRSPSQSLHRFPPTSPYNREHDLSAITEMMSPSGPSKDRTTENIEAFSDSSDVSRIENIGERPYIPEFKWEDRQKWPAFIKTWPPFIWTCIQDSFSTNPYKLHPFVYIAMGACLVWCILTKCALVTIAIVDMMKAPWDEEAEKEARRLTDMTVGILPYVVQLVLFLFPPLLASSS